MSLQALCPPQLAELRLLQFLSCVAEFLGWIRASRKERLAVKLHLYMEQPCFLILGVSPVNLGMQRLRCKPCLTGLSPADVLSTQPLSSFLAESSDGLRSDF